MGDWGQTTIFTVNLIKKSCTNNKFSNKEKNIAEDIYYSCMIVKNIDADEDISNKSYKIQLCFNIIFEKSY